MIDHLPREPIAVVHHNTGNNGKVEQDKRRNRPAVELLKIFQLFSIRFPPALPFADSALTRPVFDIEPDDHCFVLQANTHRQRTIELGYIFRP